MKDREYINVLGVPNFGNYEAAAALLKIPRFDVQDLFDKDNKLQTAAIETLFSGD